jgi:serine/threonine protein phosphatase 1
VIDRLIALNATGRLIPLFGNHDEMMLEALAEDGAHRRMWLVYGGMETLESYGLGSGGDTIPEAHLAFLRGCRPWYESETHLFAHATVNPLLPMSEQSPDDLRWVKLDGPIQHYSGKRLICGHTRQLSGRPLVLPGVVCIDTAVYEGEGWLTCLHVEGGDYWQANERGTVRTGNVRDEN